MCPFQWGPGRACRPYPFLGRCPVGHRRHPRSDPSIYLHRSVSSHQSPELLLSTSLMNKPSGYCLRCLPSSTCSQRSMCLGHHSNSPAHTPTKVDVRLIKCEIRTCQIINTPSKPQYLTGANFRKLFYLI